MPNRQQYNVDAIWDDPFDRPPDNRSSSRFDIRIKIKIAVQLANKSAPLVGVGLVRNISTEGVYCMTKHRLSVGQEVKLLFLADRLPSDSGVSRKIVGTGKVVRVEPPDSENRSHVAIKFDKDLGESIEFSIFSDYLRSISGLISPS